MSETDFSGWLTKREAAARLGVAEKTLERMSKRGEVQQATRKRPGTPGEVVYHPGDIDRIADAMQKPPAPFVVPQNEPGTLIKATPANSQNPLEALAAVVGAIRPTERVRLAERLFLTLDEAADYSGLPKRFLRELMSEGKIGMKTGSGWRIRRSDLEKL